MASRESVNPFWTKAIIENLLAALSTRPAAAQFVTPHVLLFTNDFQPSYTTAVGDFVEATFDGYSAGGIALPTLSAPVLLSGGARALLGDVTFVAGGAIVAPGETVYGYYIVGNSGADLYAFERFTDTVPFLWPGDFLDLSVRFPEPALRTAY